MSAIQHISEYRNPARSQLVNVPLDLIKKDEVLPFPLYVSISGRPVLFRLPGDELSQSRAERLRGRVESLYIPRSALELIGSREVHLPSDQSSLGSFDYASEIRNILFAISCDVDTRKSAQTTQIDRMRNLAFELAKAIHFQPKLAGTLIRRYGDSNLYYISHSLNVAIYSVMMGMKQGLSLESLQLIAFGALVHNIGNIFVPDSILFKSGSLTLSEWRVIQEHPSKGGRFFETLEAPNEVIQMIQQHHERIDGKGYPFALSGNQINLFSRICTIADVFDALISHRPYRKAVSPYEALQIMTEMKGKFDPKILTAIQVR